MESILLLAGQKVENVHLLFVQIFTASWKVTTTPQYHKSEKVARINSWCINQIFPYTNSELLLTTLEGLKVQCPGVKQLKYSPPVFLNYGYSPPAVHKAFNKVLSESRTNTRLMCLYHPINSQYKFLTFCTRWYSPARPEAPLVLYSHNTYCLVFTW